MLDSDHQRSFSGSSCVLRLQWSSIVNDGGMIQRGYFRRWIAVAMDGLIPAYEEVLDESLEPRSLSLLSYLLRRRPQVELNF